MFLSSVRQTMNTFRKCWK